LKEKRDKIILFNPRSATHNHRLPISILQIGASIFGIDDFVFVDGNLENDLWPILNGYLESDEFKFFACTVMPGPQLKQAVFYTKAIKEKFPEIITIWGGYFPSIHYRVCMESGIIDYIVRGPGDQAFPKLVKYLNEEKSSQLPEIGNLIYKMPEGKLVVNPMDPIPDQDTLPDLPLGFLEKFYPVEKYITHTFIGKRTFSFHSSIGCPYACGFCGVACIYNATWKGKSARKIVNEILHLKTNYNIDAIEFHDSNFFCSHNRTIEFSSLMKGQNIRWWAEGRIDTMNHYSDDELQLIKESGCCLVFMGAETGNEVLLSRINKGPAFHVNDTVELIRRFRCIDIIPELSFVLGFPESNPQKIRNQIREDISFIRRLKHLNPGTEVVIYLFNPVPGINSELYRTVIKDGFSFPSTLDDWLTKEWENFSLRTGDKLPWLKPSIIRYIRNFETVMTAAYPGVSNFQISKITRRLLKIPGIIRYVLGWYSFPYEIKILLRLFGYQRPEKEGFYSQ